MRLKLGNQYIIPFTGLKDGEHDFNFRVEKQFFDDHELLESPGGDIDVSILLGKKTNMLTLHIKISGTIEIQCDRCLDYFNYPVDYTANLVVKFGDEEDLSNDELWILHHNEHELNMEQFIFECISLSLPIQKIHPEKADGSEGCNPEMLDRLNDHKAEYHDHKQETDPRWNGLKDLLNDTNKN